jgi:signal transduction histidine kinase
MTWSARALAGEGTVLLVGHDVTELHEAQRQALQAERLATIGQMAAGLAHESRGALQRSQASLERLRWRLQDQAEALDLVARVQAGLDDLLRLFEGVRGYAAPMRLDVAPCDLAAVWREAWAQTVDLHPGRDARLLEAPGGNAQCRADAFCLAQVFRNIFDNALAACPGPARVRVVGEDADLGGAPAVQVTVQDNGPGLSAEQCRHLFDPFYTTKPKGTGLGMAIAKRVVEAHGGRISAGNGPGGGAEIVVTLPRSRS